MSYASSIIRRIDEALRRLESIRHRHVQGYGLIWASEAYLGASRSRSGALICRRARYEIVTAFDGRWVEPACRLDEPVDGHVELVS
jgi:hypothetical protein